MNDTPYQRRLLEARLHSAMHRNDEGDIRMLMEQLKELEIKTSKAPSISPDGYSHNTRKK